MKLSNFSPWPYAFALVPRPPLLPLNLELWRMEGTEIVGKWRVLKMSGIATTSMQDARGIVVVVRCL